MISSANGNGPSATPPQGPSTPSQSTWTMLVDQTAAHTLLPRANSWYMGANVPGKPRRFMPYAGGPHTYADICNAVVAKGYEGFTIRQGDQILSDQPGFTCLPTVPDIPTPLLAIIAERLEAFTAAHAQQDVAAE
ncbi:hypothetical protein [Polymorphobacter multimanifer]|nr:hypothetical protein [Polymorphobacter multimanifer]